jgi:hypothetical protein
MKIDDKLASPTATPAGRAGTKTRHRGRSSQPVGAPTRRAPLVPEDYGIIDGGGDHIAIRGQGSSGR